MDLMANASDGAPRNLPTEELYALVAVARRSADHGRVEDAQALLEGLALLDPDRSFLRTTLGCLYMRLGRNEEALAAFEAALALDPRDVAALTYAGELRLEQGERERGVELLSAAVETDPDGRDPHASRARNLRALAEASVEA
jgi:tetratricopeptide (TPR) repeat protein